MDANQKKMIKLIECPRDAMQGWPDFIPTEKKISYLNALLDVGFDSLDFGSFVSARAIPQMADTNEVIEKLNNSAKSTRLLAIVANIRGAEQAASYRLIQDIGFPFSISETFQQRNTHSSLAESLLTVQSMQEICIRNNKRLVVYISMAFGNPYGDPWSPEHTMRYIDLLEQQGIQVISLADTVGLATPSQVFELTKALIGGYPRIEAGVHLHSRRENAREKLEAALEAGCLRFDGALNGIGGCPMAGDELVGNMDTLQMISYFKDQNLLPLLDEQALQKSVMLAGEIFLNH